MEEGGLLTVLRYIGANPLRARLVARAGEYRWSSFGCHGDGRVDALLAVVTPYETLAAGAAATMDGLRPSDARRG